MDPETLQAKGLRPSQVRQAYLDRFASKLGARATLVASPDSPIYGTIMRVTHAEIDQLYSDPSVSTYRPEPVLAQLADGTAELALCFNLPRAPELSSGDPQYAATLQAVTRKMGLPEAYIAGLADGLKKQS